MGWAQFARILCTCVIVFIFFVEGINSQTNFIANSENPENPGFCHFKDEYSPEGSKISMYLKPEQLIKHPKECYEIHCNKNLGLSVTGCGLATESEKWILVKGNKFDPFPSCCDKLQCRD